MATAARPTGVQLVALVLDAVAPAVLARFWAHALRWGIREAERGAVELVPTDETSFGLLLTPGAVPKEGQNRITWSGPPLMPRLGRDRFHLHLAPTAGTGPDDALGHLLALGATRLAAGHGCHGAIALTDVDGNLLCFTRTAPASTSPGRRAAARRAVPALR